MKLPNSGSETKEKKNEWETKRNFWDLDEDTIGKQLSVGVNILNFAH